LTTPGLTAYHDQSLSWLSFAAEATCLMRPIYAAIHSSNPAHPAIFLSSLLSPNRTTTKALGSLTARSHPASSLATLPTAAPKVSPKVVQRVALKAAQKAAQKVKLKAAQTPLLYKRETANIIASLSCAFETRAIRNYPFELNSNLKKPLQSHDHPKS
jgi:hypothetical protein